MATEIATEEWLATVLEDHRELAALVEELRQFLDRPRPEIGKKGSHTWAASLSQRLVRLHDRLFRHFRYEEDEGMREDLIVRYPEAARRIEGVMDEHGEMLGEIRSLMSDALAYSEGRAPDKPRLRKRLVLVLEQLHHHEREENRLIQGLEYRDVGVAD